MIADLLVWLQETPVALWVSTSPSLLGYPTILTLHTLGLAMLVGPNFVVDLRVLGAARRVPVGALAPLFPIMWTGLAINAASGTLLFMADALRKSGQPIFWVKLLCIAGAVVLLVRLRRVVGAAAGDEGARPSGRGAAAASFVLWTGAIVAGRLMAYM